jgi:uncharacterized protein with PIN domain
MKFIADRMLGKLAKELRILGYDTVFYRSEDTHQLIHCAREEGRAILTRNSKLLPKGSQDSIVHVREDNPFLQLKELIQKGHISLVDENLFSRCLLCNILLYEIPRNEAEGKVPDFIFHQHKNFYRCPQCQRIYWPGSHQKNMKRRIRELQMEDGR